jgi:hypothetical protein
MNHTIDRSGGHGLAALLVCAAWVLLSQLNLNFLSPDEQTVDPYDTGKIDVISNANHVNDIAYDAFRDVVWAATSGGVVRWAADGSSHRKFTVIDGLPVNSWRTVAVDEQDGEVLFGSYFGGVARLDADDNWHWDSESQHLADPINDITIDQITGDRWIAGGSALVRLQSDGTFGWWFELGDVYSVVIHAETGKVWAADDYCASTSSPCRRVLTWPRDMVGDGADEVQAVALPDLADSDAITSLAIDQATGRLWIGTGASGLMVREPSGETSVVAHLDPLKYGAILSVAFLADEVWVGTEGGMFVQSASGIWRDVGDELEGFPLMAATRTTDGKVWLALQSGGGVATASTDGSWRRLLTADAALSGWMVGPVWSDSGRQIFAMTDIEQGLLPRGTERVSWNHDGKALFYRDGRGRWSSLWRLEMQACGRWALYSQISNMVDRDHVIYDQHRRGHWFLDEGDHCDWSRLYFFDARHSVSELHIPSSSTIYLSGFAINQESQELWVVSSVGAWLLRADDSWTQFTTADGLLDDSLYSVAVDEVTGDVWFGSATGASRLSNDGAWKHYDTTLGSALGRGSVLVVVPDSDSGDVWILTPDRVLRLSNEELSVTFNVEAEFDDMVLELIVDDYREVAWVRVGSAGGDGSRLYSIDRQNHVQELTHPSVVRERPWHWARALAYDADSHSLWVSTADAWLAAGTVGTIYELDRSDNWHSRFRGGFFSLDIDPTTGDMWAGVYGGGFLHVSRAAIPSYDSYIPATHR